MGGTVAGGVGGQGPAPRLCGQLERMGRMVMVGMLMVGLMLVVLQVGSVLVLVTVYWVPAFFYTMVDLFRPSMLYKYKVAASCS